MNLQRLLSPTRLLSRTILLASLGAVALVTLSLWGGPGQIVHAAGNITGTVFLDYDADGVKDTTEPGVAGVLVKAYTPAGAQAGSTATTASDGTYTINTTGSTGPYRVEFTQPADESLSYASPSYHSKSSVGNGTVGNAGSSVQIVPDGGVSNINLALMDPCTYCQTNPRLIIPALDAVDPALETTLSEDFALISVNYDQTSQTNLATAANIGSAWGVAYKNTANLAFVSSFLKRHAGLGPRGLDGVYVLNMSNANVNNSNGFDLQGITAANGGAIDVGSITRTQVSGTISNNSSGDTQLSTADNTASVDLDAFDKIGKAGFGDIDVAPDGSLWLVNLNQKTLIKVDTTQLGTLTNNPNTLSGTAVNHWRAESGTGPAAAPLITGAPSCTNGNRRFFGLKFYRNKGYIGMVCDASGSSTRVRPSELDGYILSFNPTNPTAFTTEVTLDFSHVREFAYQGGNNTNTVPGAWQRWASSWSDFNTVSAVLDFTSAPQPIISDIEFSDSGAMLIAITDRGAHQGGNYQYNAIAFGQTGDRELIRLISAGDLLRVPVSGAGWGTPESGDADTGSSPAPSDASSVTTFLSNDSVGGTGEFFWADYFPRNTAATHGETWQGGIAVRHGSGQVVTNAYDPRPNETWEQGLVFPSSDTSVIIPSAQRYALFDSDPSGNGTTRKRFGKGSGLGDIELLCLPPPQEVGNRVWQDTNANGLQDPNESGISGLTVRLFEGSTLIGTTTTDSNGEYYFSSASLGNFGTDGVPNTADDLALSGLKPSSNGVTHTYTVRIELGQGSNTTLLSGKSITTLNVAQPANGNASATTNDPFKDVADSDASFASNIYSLSYTTGGPGTSNHGLDFGFYTRPTADELGEFTAQLNKKGQVRLRWNTLSEHNLTGFDILRSSKRNDPGSVINPNLVPAQSPGALSGNSYTFLDETVVAGKRYFYTLNIHDINGSTRTLGPVRVKLPAAGCNGESLTAALQSPTNGAQVKKGKIEFNWTSSSCAVKYKWQLREDSPQGKLVASDKNLTTPSASATKLRVGKTYFWRVMSCDAQNQCASSEWGHFTIQANNPKNK